MYANIRVTAREQIHVLYNIIIAEPKMNVIISGELVAERLSFEAKSWRPQS